MALLIWWRFDADSEAARNRVTQASVLFKSGCGPIEYQEAGAGIPLLAVHGSGHEQGMAFAAPPEMSAIASARERARVNAMLDNILPVMWDCASISPWASISHRRHWNGFTPRVLSSARATTAMAPMPAQNTRPAELPEPGSSVLKQGVIPGLYTMTT